MTLREPWDTALLFAAASLRGWPSPLLKTATPSAIPRSASPQSLLECPLECGLRTCILFGPRDGREESFYRAVRALGPHMYTTWPAQSYNHLHGWDICPSNSRLCFPLLASSVHRHVSVLSYCTKAYNNVSIEPVPLPPRPGTLLWADPQRGRIGYCSSSGSLKNNAT